ncbi:MAG: GntR family transcriptional regulator [Coriobacteriales bacterium]|nr:GntR family transcriptional regulator [Coriobacteriales bacterium]
MLKYQTIVMDIRHKIADGDYSQGDRLPTIPELCKLYDVSKITVKRAMDELESIGLIARRRGSGTYVKGIAGTSTLTSARNALTQGEAILPDSEMLGSNVTRTVHEFMVVQPPSDIAQILDIAPDAFTYYICRTRFADGVPDRVEHTYVPLSISPSLRKSDMEGSLYRYIVDQLGLKVASAHRAIAAVHPTVDEARWLGVELQTPLVSVRQVGYLDDGTAFEVSTCVHAPGYEFFTVSTK